MGCHSARVGFDRRAIRACYRLSAGHRDVGEDDVLVRFTSRDVLALGQFFVLSMLKWVQSVQIARRRAQKLREAILAKMGAELEYGEYDDEEILIN